MAVPVAPGEFPVLIASKQILGFILAGFFNGSEAYKSGPDDRAGIISFVVSQPA